VADRLSFGGLWALGMAFQVVGCGTDEPRGPVQTVVVLGLVTALIGGLGALVRGRTSTAGWAFSACACGLLAATLDLPTVPTVAVRELGLYSLLTLATGAFAVRWDFSFG
jgi:hypothetical protein